jgi:hypothetical protein
MNLLFPKSPFKAAAQHIVFQHFRFIKCDKKKIQEVAACAAAAYLGGSDNCLWKESCGWLEVCWWPAGRCWSTCRPDQLLSRNRFWSGRERPNSEWFSPEGKEDRLEILDLSGNSGAGRSWHRYQQGCKYRPILFRRNNMKRATIKAEKIS